MHILGTNLSQFCAHLWIAANSRDQSAPIRCATPDCYSIWDQSIAIQLASMNCCTFAGQICSNWKRCDGWLHIGGTNLLQFSAQLRIAANSRDQSVRIQCATTDYCTFRGPICSNSARFDELLHMVAFDGLLHICRTYICRNSGHHYGLLQTIGTNLSQFGALRRIAAHSWDQSVAIRRAAKVSCTIRDQSVAIQRTSTDICTFGDKSVAIRRATTDCCKFARPNCRNSARYDGLLHIRRTNL